MDNQKVELQQLHSRLQNQELQMQEQKKLMSSSEQ